MHSSGTSTSWCRFSFYGHLARGSSSGCLGTDRGSYSRRASLQLKVTLRKPYAPGSLFLRLSACFGGFRHLPPRSCNAYWVPQARGLGSLMELPVKEEPAVEGSSPSDVEQSLGKLPHQGHGGLRAKATIAFLLA